jgi:hypothetical protein
MTFPKLLDIYAVICTRAAEEVREALAQVYAKPRGGAR